MSRYERRFRVVVVLYLGLWGTVIALGLLTGRWGFLAPVCS